MRKSYVVAMCAALLASLVPIGSATAHRISAVTSRSICHYEERYFVWTPDKPWKVVGRVRPEHRGMRVVLQRSKYGHQWRKWKATTTDSDGRYRFSGIAPDRGSDWWVNLRVFVPRQGSHNRVIGKSMYIDTNLYARCV